MDDSLPSDPLAALAHYKQLCSSLQDKLQSAEDDINDFSESSKELQRELEKELETMEMAERGLRREMETERGRADEWKTKYTSALRDHTTTITHMQRELESLRASEKELRGRLRDVEMENDEIEKSGRETSSSLADVEGRYNKSLERIALLEEELVTKAQLDEEVQRLKDELRDVNEELAVTRDSAAASLAARSSIAPSSRPSSPPSSPPPRSSSSQSATPRRRAPSPQSPESPTRSTPTVALLEPTPFTGRTLPPSPLDQPRTNAVASSSSSISNGYVSSPAYRAPLSSSSSLSRSTRTQQLQSFGLPSSPSSPDFRKIQHSTSIPASPSTRRLPLTPATRATRATVTRSDTTSMIRDMQEMTARVKGITQRLDERRGKVMRGSAIPRASMGGSPTSAGGGLTRSSTVRSIPSAAAIPRPKSRLAERESTRPPSRSALRQSILPASSTSHARPSSRMSSLSSASHHSHPSRPLTPSMPPPPPRSSTPTASRPPWGASKPSSTAGSTPAALERRRTSSVLSKSVHGRIPSGSGAPAGAGVDLGATIRRPPSSLGQSTSSSVSTSRPSSALGQSTSSASATAADKAARRTSLGLGVSVNGLARSVMGSGSRRASSALGRREREVAPPLPMHTTAMRRD